MRFSRRAPTQADLDAAPPNLDYNPSAWSQRIPICVIAAVAFVISVYLGSAEPPPPHAQNHLIVGLLLAMLAIIPSEASRRPLGWRELEAKDS